MTTEDRATHHAGHNDLPEWNQHAAGGWTIIGSDLILRVQTTTQIVLNQTRPVCRFYLYRKAKPNSHLGISGSLVEIRTMAERLWRADKKAA